MSKELSFNQEHNTVIANDILMGKQSMSLQTARLIRLLITQVAEHDKDLKTYTCRIADLADFLGVSTSNLYRDVRSVCECAMKSVVYIGTGNPKAPWELIHWLDTAKYDGNGNLTLRLSDELKPYVLELSAWFTQYKLKHILSLSSFYALRLYELIKCEDGRTGGYQSELVFDLEDLRRCLGCEKKYAAFKDFRKRVIEVAVREINDKSDIYIIPTYQKQGRAVASVAFEIHQNFKRFQQ